MSDYSKEDEFYGRAYWEGVRAGEPAIPRWDELADPAQERTIRGAKAARAAKYEDPVVALYDDFAIVARDIGGLMAVARRAYQLGARATKDGAE